MVIDRSLNPNYSRIATNLDKTIIRDKRPLSTQGVSDSPKYSFR